MPPRRRIPVKKLPPPEVENSTKKSPPKKSKSLNESNIFREQKWAYQLRLKSLCLSNDWFDFEMALEVSSLLLSLDIQFLHWSDYFRHAVILERVRTETSVLAFLNWALLSPLVRHDVRGNVEISTFTKRISRKIESYQDETPSDYSNFDKPRFERSLLSLQNRRVNTDMFPPGWIPVISEKSIASIISQARLYGIPTDTLRDSLLNSDEKIAESVTIFHQLGDLEINHRKVIAIARDHLVMGRNQACMDVLKSIPSHCQELSDFISLRICVLFQVKNKTELFSLSHSLFRDHHQNDPFPWMAAGLYYLLSERLDEARQFLLRGLRINSKIKELHQSLACCYSKIGDHDQAVATYSRIISQVDSSCGVTLLAIAGEYLRVDRPLLAGPYLDQYDMLRSPEARLKLRNCPFYCNELGVMMYQRKRYRESVRAFRSGFVAAQGSGTMIERVLIINGDMAALRSFYEARDPTSLFSLISQMMGRSEIYPLRWRALVYELAALILPVSTPSDVDDNRYRVQRRSLLNKAVECLTGAPPVPSSKIIGVSTIPRHLHRLLSILQS